jgi:hypothetical protein
VANNGHLLHARLPAVGDDAVQQHLFASVSVAAIVSMGYTWRIFTLPAKIGSEPANTCLS